MPKVSVEERDYLEQDDAIRGQNYVCMSFISPEDAIGEKEGFVVSKFMQALCKDAKDMFDKLKEISADEAQDTVIGNMMDRYPYLLDPGALMKEYGMFKSDNEVALSADFSRENDDVTCVRGIKVRGSYDTLDEAKARASSLKKKDDKHHIYVAEVGCWCPLAPNPEQIESSEYSETALNTLMKKYKENMESKDEYYMARKGEMYEAAKREGEGQGQSAGSGPGSGSGGDGAEGALLGEDRDTWESARAGKAPAPA